MDEAYGASAISALGLAAKAGSAAAVRTLIDAGTSVNRKFEKMHGASAL